jgi:hypothetical protein
VTGGASERGKVKIATEFQETEAYSSLDLTKAKYITRPSMVQTENVRVRISPDNFIPD